MKEIRRTIQTLTPLWTGGVDQTSDRLHLTGVMGSLRYWYEGIVRGFGLKTCVTVGDAESRKALGEPCRCMPDQKVDEPEHNICPVCRLFGTTGWKRRFTIRVAGLSCEPLFFMASRSVHSPTANWLKRIYQSESAPDHRGKGFRFSSRVLWGRADMTIAGEVWAVDRIAAVLDFVARFGAIGAKTQNGFGQFTSDPGLSDDRIREAFNAIRADANARCESSGEESRLFSLSHLFSLTYRLNQPESYFSQLVPIGVDVPKGAKTLYYPCAYDLRYKNQQKHPGTGRGRDNGLRMRFKGPEWPRYTAAKLFGSDKNNSWDNNFQASRIHVSHPFRPNADSSWRLKVWGDIPGALWNGNGTHPDRRRVEGITDAFIKEIFPGSTVTRQFNKEDWIDGR